MGSNGMIPADREFLKGLRELCDELDILLIFDEVITGFRLARGGAQEYYGVLPDITTFGKILGGGIFPAGGFGGREDIMELLDQTKRKHYEMSFHGGTYAGNPLTARAGYTLLSELIKGDVYPKINALGEKARKGLEDIFSRHKVNAHVTGVGSLFAVHFTKEKPRDIRGAIGDTQLAKDCFYFMLNNNILCMKPSKQVFAPSAAHSEEDIELLLSVMEEFLKRVPT
jgi:glutamate-1-semialdehyde 2,1-aminomutase